MAWSLDDRGTAGAVTGLALALGQAYSTRDAAGLQDHLAAAYRS